MRDEPNRIVRCQKIVHQIPQRVLVLFDSRTVVMEVETRLGVCNNSPAERTSPENGWRLNGLPIDSHHCKTNAMLSNVAWKPVAKRLA